MSETDARYHSITLEPDDMAKDGAWRLKFSTMPGMSMTVGDLHMGDLDALYRLLGEHSGGMRKPLTITLRRPAPGVPCGHCGGVGSGCQCDIEYG